MKTITNEKLINDINAIDINCNKNFKWYKRLWILISNPFCYIFYGYIRY